MSAPAASSIVLPSDATNAGKKVQTQSEVIGGDTVHAHYFIPRSRRKLLGLYSAPLAVQSVQAGAQNGAATAFAWLQIPAASTVRARLRRVILAFTTSADAADMLSVPRIVVARGTFTGVASGAELVPGKRSTADPANSAKLRTTSAGWTPTLDANLFGMIVPTFGFASAAGYGWNGGPAFEWSPRDEEEWFDIQTGEYLSVYQPDAGTAADARRFSLSIAWDEYDNA